MDTASHRGQSWFNALDEKFVKCGIPVVPIVDTGAAHSQRLTPKCLDIAGCAKIDVGEHSECFGHRNTGPWLLKIDPSMPPVYVCLTQQGTGGVGDEPFDVGGDAVIGSVRPIPFDHGKLGTMLWAALRITKATADLKNAWSSAGGEQALHVIFGRRDEPARAEQLTRVEKGLVSGLCDDRWCFHLDKATSQEELPYRGQSLAA